jgi:endonuclease III related protein
MKEFSSLSPAHKENEVLAYYRALSQAWGPQHWWPAETCFEVVVGAYLTQNTAWTNVERALANLRAVKALSVEGIRRMKLPRLERLLQPSGYFRQKAKRLKTFVAFLDKEYGGSLDQLFSQPTEKLREELLNLNGVGPETADSILLYAGNHPVFVVDAYTRRILARHDILPAAAEYEEIRELFQRSLESIVQERRDAAGSGPQGLKPGSFVAQSGTAQAMPFPNPSSPIGTTNESNFRGAAHPPSAMSTAPRTALVQIYNEMHGLLVGVGKNHCGKSQPKCDGCPLQRFLLRDK